jgi:prepilin signal peptidase PulO-like enzyme (type II secretory pathway)
VVLKTIPLFWIPVHTITFMLPPHYRVVIAAYLSIVLGVFLVYSNKKNQEEAENQVVGSMGRENSPGA